MITPGFTAVRSLASLAALLATLGVGACESTPYVFLATEGPLRLRPGDSAVVVANYAREEVHFPFASSISVIYTSRERPEAFRWTSYDSTVASVDGHGVVRARRQGTTAIAAETRRVASRPEQVTVLP